MRLGRARANRPQALRSPEPCPSAPAHRQQLEVSVEQAWAHGLTFVLVEAAANEIGDIFHAAAAPDVLKIDRSGLAPVVVEAEVGQLGVSMDEGLERAVGESAIDGRCRRLEWAVLECVKFVGAGGQVPIGASGPQALGTLPHEGGVEAGQPRQDRRRSPPR